ncbi:MAG: nucleotide exchange factor GrpE [Idiomarina sp.]|nr:nucleotide exchange factor GrpE [Idiomarina sp.]
MSKPDHPQSEQEKQQQEAQAHNVDSVEENMAEDDSEQQPGAEGWDLLQRIGELEAALAASKDEAASRKDAAIRAAAEAENVRRRAALDVQKARDFALEKFAAELLPVVDNLERALQTFDQTDESVKSLIEGIEMTRSSFLNTLEKFGVVALDPHGETFNPEHHEAMGMQESEEHPANTVIAVMQKGYTLNGRLLRPAMVMVSRAPSAGVNTTA